MHLSFFLFLQNIKKKQQQDFFFHTLDIMELYLIITKSQLTIKDLEIS